MKKNNTDFFNSKWDATLVDALSGKLNDKQKNELHLALENDPTFREKFCDWIKSLREPAWFRNKGKNRYEA